MPPKIPRIGVRISAFRDVTIDVNAPPTITPTAISITFPRRINFLNSPKNLLCLFICNTPPCAFAYLFCINDFILSQVEAENYSPMSVPANICKWLLIVFSANSSSYNSLSYTGSLQK